MMTSRWVAGYLRFLMPLGLSLFLPACMVGPDFEPPDVVPPEAFHPGEPGPDSVITDGPAIVGWWTTLGDPQLTDLVERASRANLDVAQARSRVLQAREARAIAAGGLWPSLDAAASVDRTGRSQQSFDNQTASPGEGVAVARLLRSSVTTYDATLDASWELDLFGGQRRAVEAAGADADAANEDLRNTQVSLLAEVATRYVSVRGFQQRLLVARRNAELQARSAEIARKRHDAGFASVLDVSNAEAELASTRATIPALESSLRQEMYMLSTLLGEPPLHLIPELDPTKEIPSPPHSIPAGLPSELLRRRPDIRAAEAQLHAETARIGMAVADLFPRLTLTAALGLDGNSVSALGDWRHRMWQLGAGVAAPVLDGGARRANVRRQEAVREEVLARYQNTVLVALREVESALVAFQKEQVRQAELSQAVAASKRARETATTLYSAGNTDFLSVVIAERALFAAEDALSSSRQTAMLNLILLYKALGGGWEILEDAPA